MKMKRISFHQYYQSVNNKNEWEMKNFQLKNINLVVGKNATGKTRALNIIANLGKLLSGRIKKLFSDHVSYEVCFHDKHDLYSYFLEYKDGKVLSEIYKQNDNILLERGRGGIGKIWFKKSKKHDEFQAPENELASVARRDTIQHPFFEKLFEWGSSIRHFKFGEKLGKERVATFLDKNAAGINLQTEFDNSVHEIPYEPASTNNPIGALEEGRKKYGEAFVEEIIVSMNGLGYEIEDIGIGLAKDIKTDPPGLANIVALNIKEKGLKDSIGQIYISQGMWRALSLIIQINLAQREKKDYFILIDDIGEGLDFDRSAALIKYLVRVATDGQIQIAMTTNDRFVMNSVPLNYWSLMYRDGHIVNIINKENSAEIFEEFEFTGLSNFDFLSSEFYKHGFEE